MSDPVEMYRTPWMRKAIEAFNDDDCLVFDTRDSHFKVVKDMDHIDRAIRCVNFLNTAHDDVLDAIVGSPVHQMILGLLAGDKELATLAAQSVADAILGDEPGLIWKEKLT